MAGQGLSPLSVTPVGKNYNRAGELEEATVVAGELHFEEIHGHEDPDLHKDCSS